MKYRITSRCWCSSLTNREKIYHGESSIIDDSFLLPIHIRRGIRFIEASHAAWYDSRIKYSAEKSLRVKSNDTYPFSKILREIWRTTQPHWAGFFVGSILRVIGDIAWLYPAYALARIVSLLSKEGVNVSREAIIQIFVLWGLAIAARTIAQTVGRFLIFRLARKVSLDMEHAAYVHMLALPIAWHEQENVGNKMQRIRSGREEVFGLFRVWFVSIIEIIVNLFGIVVIILSVDMGIAITLGCFLLLYYLIASGLIKKIAIAAKKENEEWEIYTGIKYEAMNALRSVKVLGFAPKIIKRISQNAQTVFASASRKIYLMNTRSFAQLSLANVFRMGALMFIVYGITKGRYEVGFLILFHSYFNTVLDSIYELADVSESLATAKVSIGRMLAIQEVPTEQDSDTAQVYPLGWKTLSIKNLRFSYGDTPVLQNISFDIKRGERVGIVGLSGAGKSTLFKILLKEYTGQGKHVVLDGIPLDDITRKSYLAHTAVVLQDTEVFNMSLKENIVIVGDHKNKKEAKKYFGQATEVAHVDDFAHALPNGIDTLIGEKGVKLSGGQKQRLGIARAVYKNPDILFLDEATSHLDVESEAKIQDALHAFFGEVTAVVIAHRLSTIREMDRIIVIEGGRKMEEGSFDTLMKKKGRLYKLWNMQRV